MPQPILPSGVMVTHLTLTQRSVGSSPALASKLLRSSKVERLTVNQDVAGSSPAVAAIRGVSQVVKTSDFLSDIHGFESRTPFQIRCRTQVAKGDCLLNS